MYSLCDQCGNIELSQAFNWSVSAKRHDVSEMSETCVTKVKCSMYWPILSNLDWELKLFRFHNYFILMTVYLFHLLLPAQRLPDSYKLIKEIQFNSKEGIWWGVSVSLFQEMFFLKMCDSKPWNFVYSRNANQSCSTLIQVSPIHCSSLVFPSDVVNWSIAPMNIQ